MFGPPGPREAVLTVAHRWGGNLTIRRDQRPRPVWNSAARHEGLAGGGTDWVSTPSSSPRDQTATDRQAAVHTSSRWVCSLLSTRPSRRMLIIRNGPPYTALAATVGSIGRTSPVFMPL